MPEPPFSAIRVGHRGGHGAGPFPAAPVADTPRGRRTRPIRAAAVGAARRRIARSAARRAARQAQLPTITYDESLPIHARRQEIAAAIAGHSLVIVCGETGSGKSTQLPKICLELGRGVDGFIGHTQPRRLAARTIATRLAEELHSPLGQDVGYKIRFTDRTRPETYVKLMTDGILLAETPTDRFLNQYDTIILDEAHERSLNIDFLLGYLRRLLPKRPELRLHHHLGHDRRRAFSRSLHSGHRRDTGDRGLRAGLSRRSAVPCCRTLARRDGTGGFRADRGRRRRTVAGTAGRHPGVPADGTRHPRGGHGFGTPTAAADRGAGSAAALRAAVRQRAEPRLSISLAATRCAGHERRRVVADRARHPVRGRHRHGSYQPLLAAIQGATAPDRSHFRASADQRKGRCGRLGPGICIRLYGEDDYLGRDQYTTPEIRRTNLAAVILQTLALKLGDIEDFPFLDPPRADSIRDGFKTLFELGPSIGIELLLRWDANWLDLPVDPRVGRMILAADERNCLEEVLIIAAGLEMQDPRERPVDKARRPTRPMRSSPMNGPIS